MKNRENHPSIFLLICGLAFSLLVGGCKKEEGQGSIVTRQLPLASVEGIDMSAAGKVYLTEGRPQTIEVRGQANILDLLKTNVDNGVWTIGFKQPVSSYGELTIYITAPALKRVVLSGAGEIQTLTPLTAPNLTVALPGSGQISLAANTRTLSASLAGVGNLTLSGTAATQDVRLSGTGEYHAFALPSADATVTLSGSGTAEVRATTTLRAILSGSGNVRYQGRPAIQTIASGSGQVIDSN